MRSKESKHTLENWWFENMALLGEEYERSACEIGLAVSDVSSSPEEGRYWVVPTEIPGAGKSCSSHNEAASFLAEMVVERTPAAAAVWTDTSAAVAAANAMESFSWLLNAFQLGTGVLGPTATLLLDLLTLFTRIPCDECHDGVSISRSRMRSLKKIPPLCASALPRRQLRHIPFSTFPHSPHQLPILSSTLISATHPQQIKLQKQNFFTTKPSRSL